MIIRSDADFQFLANEYEFSEMDLRFEKREITGGLGEDGETESPDVEESEPDGSHSKRTN